MVVFSLPSGIGPQTAYTIIITSTPAMAVLLVLSDVVDDPRLLWWYWSSYAATAERHISIIAN